MARKSSGVISAVIALPEGEKLKLPVSASCASSAACSRSSCNSSSYTEFFLNCVNQLSQFQNRQFLDIFNELQNLFRCHDNNLL